MVTKVEEPTAFVLTVKVAVEAPLGTITLDGTVAAPVLLLDRETTAPPLGADALNCTVPVEELPPVTLDGLRPSETRVGRGGDVTVRVIVVVFVRVPEAPVMVTVTVPVAAVLFAVNLNVLVVVVGFGLKEAVTPLGSVEGDRATLPEKPFCGETVIVLEPLLRSEARRVGGEGGGVGMEWRRVVVRVRVPEVPVMVRVTVPVVAVGFAVSVSVLVVAVGLGLKAAVTPLGSVEGDRVTLPVKPFCGETVIVLEPLLPWVTVRLPGEAERV